MSVRSFFLCINLLWFALGVYASYVMAIAGGHPPGLVFLPLVIVAWGLGHATLWSLRKAVDRGAAAKRDSGLLVQKSWPVSVVIATLLLGIVFCSGVFTGLAVLASMVYSEGVNMRAGILRLFIWLPFAIGFIGLLLRQPWSRFLIAGGALGTAAIYLFMIVLNFRYDSINWANILFATAVLLVLVALGIWALRSRQLKGFLGLLKP